MSSRALEMDSLSSILPEGPDRQPVQRLARRLLAEAAACPALVQRSEDALRMTDGQSSGTFPAMALLSNPTLDIRRYLENLVSIAASSAQQAEDMSFEVSQVHRRSRWGMAVFASFGLLGLIVGIAGFAANHRTQVRLSQIRDEVGALQNMGQDIASLRQQRKVEEAALVREKADQRSARDALQHQIADFQRQANFLQDQIARRSHELVQAASTEASELRKNYNVPAPSIPLVKEAAAGDQQVAQGTLQHSVADQTDPDHSLQYQAARRPDDPQALVTGTGKVHQPPAAARSRTDGLR